VTWLDYYEIATDEQPFDRLRVAFDTLAATANQPKWQAIMLLND
jgi:hypothetical protein